MTDHDEVVEIEDLDELRFRAQRRERHWTMLVVASAIIVLAVAFQVRQDQRIELRLCPGYPLPETCTTRILFHQECPGCGLTRSFVHLAHGDWARSLKTHRVGWLLAVAVLAQFPYRLISLRNPMQTAAPAWSRWFGWLLIFALLGNWFYNVVNPQVN